MAIQFQQYNPQVQMPTLAPIAPQTAAANRRAGILDAILGGGGSYGGLLSAEDQDAARQRGLLAMGAQMLQASGPSPVKTSVGQALGQGLMAGQGAQQQGLQQALQAQLMQGKLAQANAPKIVRVDLGDSIGLMDERTGQIVGQLPKGASPDAVLRESGAMSRHQTPSGSAVLGSDTTIRGQNLSAQTAMRGQDIGAQAAAIGHEVALRGQDLSAGRANEAQNRKEAEKAQQAQQTWDMYRTARAGLMSGLEGTSTGPLVGRIPAITAGQQAAEGGVAAMAPVLKQLFRAAGEGVFTDRDQQLLLDMVPKRSDTPEARAIKMQNIDAIVLAKLGLPSDTPIDPAGSGSAGGGSPQLDAGIENLMQMYGPR